jgi:hypothetical protein
MELDEPSVRAVAAITRTSQIIASSLVIGVLMFAGYVLLVARPIAQAEAGTLTTIALLLGATAVVLSWVVPRILGSAQRRQIADGTWQPPRGQDAEYPTDAARLAAVYQTKLVVGAAILEGACFFALYAYWCEQQTASLAVAGILLLGLLAHVPSAGRVRNWVQDQLRQIEEGRQFSG